MPPRDGPVSSYIARPAELILLQPTTLCNLDCKYCCLPKRRERHELSFDTISSVFQNLYNDGLVDVDTRVVWHLGEPLLLPISYYERAHDLIRSIFPFRVRFQFQTNGTRLDDEWCKFFSECKADVGISIDGNELEHDLRRVDWNGGKSHSKALSGLRLLQKHGVSYNVIAVLSAETLDRANELYDYFQLLGVRRLCLNVVESEGAGIPTFLQDDNVFSRLVEFYSTLWARVSRETDPIWIREISHAQNAILSKPFSSRRSQEMEAGRILTVLASGHVVLYTPGFVSLLNKDVEKFIVANLKDKPLSQGINPTLFTELEASVARLARDCEIFCEYFDVCGGGSPAHRWAEQGGFHFHETRTCRASIQARFKGIVSMMVKSLPMETAEE